MTKNTIRIARKETKIYKVDLSEAPEWIDDLEEWAKNQVLVNTELVERDNNSEQGTSLEILDSFSKQNGQTEDKA